MPSVTSWPSTSVRRPAFAPLVHSSVPKVNQPEANPPSPEAVIAGDAFTVTPGCDKQFSTCHDKFANVVNFRGFPHIPGQDAVLRYATKDGGHEGSVL